MTTHTSINDGGPAFPGEEKNGLNSGMPGMTLRDYFAAKALFGLCSAEWSCTLTNSDTAKEAYLLADAMIKVRSA